jgi:hypothetical protein
LLVATAVLAGSARATTQPGEHTIVGVKLTDAKTVVYPRIREARGVVATFSIMNSGKKTHDWVFMGHRTPKLKPGGTFVFTVTLTYRGKYGWRSSTNAGAAFRGIFTVY